jgi:NTE family protein
MGETRDRAEFLTEVPLFADLDQELRDEVSARSRVVALNAGEWLCRQGDVGEDLYVVRSGRLEVVVEHPPPPRVVNVLGRGAALGELALLTKEPRAASVRALRDTELMAISRERFEQLLTSPRFASALTAWLARQLQTGTRFRAPRRRAVLAVLPVGEVRADEVADRLEAALATTRRVTCLRKPDGEDTSAQMQVLDRLESAHDHVLLVASPCVGAGEVEQWGRFCLRQADRIIAVAAPGTPPPALLASTLAGCDVALVGRRPHAAELAAWLDGMQARATHWLPTDHRLDESTARLARRITGQSIGVVMSGGGARAFAHLGVVQSLLEAGLVLDRFGGTSAGAFMAALFALGMAPAEAIAVCRREAVERKPYGDYTLPRFALVRGRRAYTMFRRVWGSTRVEELPRDWYAVSADLITAETVVHRRGPVVEALMASVSLPGIGPPRPVDGRLLVDGGVLNNLPIDVMADADEGPVIAIDVMSRWGQRWRERHDPARWQSSIWARLGWRDPLPTIVETIAAASGLGSWQHTARNRHRAALEIVPELVRFELFDWASLDDLVREGRRAGEEALKAQPKLTGLGNRHGEEART